MSVTATELKCLEGKKIDQITFTPGMNHLDIHVEEFMLEIVIQGNDLLLNLIEFEKDEPRKI